MAQGRESRRIELLLVFAILVALAGVVMPVISARRIEGRYRQVDADLGTIAVGIADFIDKTRTFPTGHSGATTFHYLFTDGRIPDHNVLASGPGVHLDKFLVNGEMVAGDFEPFLKRPVHSDPWGNAYLVNVNGFFQHDERVQVICAGPNGRIDTPPAASRAQDDDVLLVFR